MKFFMLLFTIIFSSHFSFAGSGDTSFGTRGGGNTEASQFFDIGVELLERLNLRGTVKTPEVTLNVENLIAMFKKTVVQVSEEALLIDGAIVDAINYPYQNRVVIYGDSWRRRTSGEKYRLVMHEILGLARTPDTQYQNSQALLEIAYVGLNWDLGYRPACQETRELSPEVSKRLHSAIFAIIKNTKANSSFTMNKFFCFTGKNLFKEVYYRCGSEDRLNPPEIDYAIVSALENAGVAKYSRLERDVTVYDIPFLSCNPEGPKKEIICKITAYWNKDCVKKN